MKTGSVKPLGHGSAAQKYDILTSLGTFALSLGKTEQRRVLRLITLITARYNWARDDLCIGQREIARMWSCNERTVKREMAWFRGQGWLIVRSQGARGRVSQYSLGIRRILNDSSVTWEKVGPDFVTRLGAREAEVNIIPMIPKKIPSEKLVPPDVSSGTEWALAQAILHQENPTQFSAWIQALKRGERAGGQLRLVAPSKFHAAYVLTHLGSYITAACQSVDGSVTEVGIVF